ncbi:phage tail protein [Acinetobacter soli]|uniref:phage tail protein n=1 Tax=Acinetobacter soli TaxID=487316 RepID=UPI00287EDD95|nr:phage tail protein [Acinetobacter soli]MDS7693801.1 phage tail protein [Acinetobacter soli]
MSIPYIKTPGTYIDVNINTQRSGLPLNTQKLLFITTDATSPDMPESVYDKAAADAAFGNNSIAGRMITAAIKTYRFVDAQAFAIQASTTTGQALSTESNDPVTTENGSGVSP